MNEMSVATSNYSHCVEMDSGGTIFKQLYLVLNNKKYVKQLAHVTSSV